MGIPGLPKDMPGLPECQTSKFFYEVVTSDPLIPNAPTLMGTARINSKSRLYGPGVRRIPEWVGYIVGDWVWGSAIAAFG
jgi:hypothetical protein